MMVGRSRAQLFSAAISAAAASSGSFVGVFLVFDGMMNGLRANGLTGYGLMVGLSEALNRNVEDAVNLRSNNLETGGNEVEGRRARSVKADVPP